MINTVSRFFKAIWYKLTGRAHEQADRLIEYPEAVRGAYEDIIRDKQGNIQRYKQAIGELIALVEQKKFSLSKLTDDIDNLEEMKEGTISKQKNLVAELHKSGTTEEDIERHPRYVLYVTSLNDFQSTIEEKNVRVEKLQQDIERAQKDIEEYKNRITFLHRDLHKIETE